MTDMQILRSAWVSMAELLQPGIEETTEDCIAVPAAIKARELKGMRQSEKIGHWVENN